MGPNTAMKRLKAKGVRKYASKPRVGERIIDYLDPSDYLSEDFARYWIRNPASQLTISNSAGYHTCSSYSMGTILANSGLGNPGTWVTLLIDPLQHKLQPPPKQASGTAYVVVKPRLRLEDATILPAIAGKEIVEAIKRQPFYPRDKQRELEIQRFWRCVIKEVGGNPKAKEWTMIKAKNLMSKIKRRRGNDEGKAQ